MRLAFVCAAWVAVIVTGLAATTSARAESWNQYLEFAYVYTPAEGDALRERLDGYAREAGQSLDDFIAESLEPALAAAPSNETRRRQLAVARFLTFLADRDPAQLESAASTIAELKDRLGRHENRYWYHTIRAHQALRFGNAPTFTREVFDLWFHVIVPLESVYDTHQTLSLERSSRAGFVAALPYLYENMSRLITIRSQDMGLGHDLDALAAVVRFLHDGRVGEHPEVIPSELSSKPYLDRVVERLDGPESDGGSLTFTLALFEASVRHEKARELLGSEGLSAATQEAIRVSIGAYENALRQADTLQGQSAVYNRVLRQIGELYAAKQRLGVSPAIDIPFSIDRAVELYTDLERDREKGWERHGYRDHSRSDYLAAMQQLWQEIQETSFNAADYEVSRALHGGRSAPEHVHNAISHYARYLRFFEEFALDVEQQEAVPDSAFFAAYWAARGIGDAVFQAAGEEASAAQIVHAGERYQQALEIFPFDAPSWSSLTYALEGQGREDEYLRMAQPLARRTTGSRALADWITGRREEGETLDAYREALSDDLALMYLGFADRDTFPDLERGLEELLEESARLEERRLSLEARINDAREARGATIGVTPSPDAPNAESAATLPPVSAGNPRVDIVKMNAEMGVLARAEARIATQIEARRRALPRFKRVLDGENLSQEMASRRDHPVHALVRRMFFESRTGASN